MSDCYTVYTVPLPGYYLPSPCHRLAGGGAVGVRMVVKDERGFGSTGVGVIVSNW